MHDVVIIGAGVSGGSAAAFLAKKGVNVVVLEKEVAAHHKVCGEFISYEVQNMLRELNIDLEAQGARTIDRLGLTKGKQHIKAPLGFTAMSLSRFRLDAILLECAKKQGALVRQGTMVTGLSYEESVWCVFCSNHETLKAKAVFLASGKHDLKGISCRSGRQNNYIGFKMHFKLTALEHKKLENIVETIFFEGGYAGLEAIEDGDANLCLVVTKNRFAACDKSWDKLLDFIKRTTPLLAKRLQGASPCWPRPLAIFGIPYGFVFKSKPSNTAGLFRLGDQMAVIPSFCGDGMAIAVYTGLEAGKAYLAEDSYKYHLKVRDKLVNQIKTATLISYLLSIRYGQSLVFYLCERFPSLVTRAIERTRLKV